VAGGLGEIFKIPELKKRLTFTFLMLIVYRIGVFVPTPGIDAERLKRMFEQASGTLFGMVNMFSGGALENFSVFALGIMPYISVSIIMQLLATTVKPLEELQKEGDQGRRKISRYTRIGTLFLALIQGFFISYGLEQQGVVALPGLQFRIMTALTLMTGTMFVMWLGEQISERGIGNGISIVIFAGIVARMPATLFGTVDLMRTGELSPFAVLGVFVFGIATVVGIVFVERCQRKIPVQYPRRAMGRQVTQATTQYLPLKLNTAGVIAAIFASALLSFPLIIANMGSAEALEFIPRYFSPGSWPYELVFAGLVIFFSYFYTSIVFDPHKISEDLKKHGGFIPTVRPGRDTARYLDEVLSRLTLWGGLYVAAICIIPSVVYQHIGVGAFSSFFGGTAVLIVVGVMLDTVSQIQSHVLARNYEGFMSRGPGKIRGGSRGAVIRGQLIKR
jgi:preprotein translocase subunit SecY